MSTSSHGQNPRSPLSLPSTLPASNINDPDDSFSNLTSTTRHGPGTSIALQSDTSQETRDGLALRSAAGVAGDTLGKRGHKSRHSSGFLLNFSSPSVEKDLRAIPRTRPSTDTKSKGKQDEVYITPAKKAVAGRQSHISRRSIGGSPLSVEVINSTVSDHHNTGTQDVDPIGKVSPDLNYASNLLPAFNTDPAQIVTLALNLSESRRRHFSTGALSPVDSIGSRRIASAVQPNAAIGPGIGGTLRQHLNQQRRGSRNLSPRLERPKTHKTVQTSSSARPQHHNSAYSTVLPGLEFDFVNSPNFTPSEATLLRAEKARNELELSYEHRRLLQYLPKLPQAEESRPSTGRLSSRKPAFHQPLGRAYNPLQYIRNRKVRVRERKQFDSEMDGWRDLNAVREWVDNLASGRQVHLSKVDDRYPLPLFRVIGKDVSLESLPPSSRSQKSTNQQTSKTARPRMDWKVTPWDLLADAYWLEQDDHKKLVEDREGNKLFPGSLQPPASLNKGPFKTLPPRRSASIHRSAVATENQVFAESPIVDPSTDERGRRRHQKQDSINHVDGISSSRDRKGKWPRRLIRSPSSSSSEESIGRSIRGLPRTRPRPTSRERQDSVLLEKQMLDLLAQEAGRLDRGPAGGLDETSQGADTESAPEPASNSKHETSWSTNRYDSPAKIKNRRSGMGKSTEPDTFVDDLDTSAPNSPNPPGIVPRISINTTPPQVRSGSLRQTNALSQAPPNTKFQQANERVNEVDFATDNRKSGDFSRYAINPSASSKIDLSNGSSSARAGDSTSRLKGRQLDIKPQKSEKDQKYLESRFRTILRGSRIPDLVSNPVSKVGDLIWRKDPSETSIMHSPVSSHLSDTEELEGSGTEDIDLLSKRDTLESEPRYHLNNLPVFKLPFKRGNEEESSSVRQEDFNHHQAALRKRGPSDRFRDLAPPGLDMRSISPPPVSAPHSDVYDSADDGIQERQQESGTTADLVHPMNRRFAVTEYSPGQESQSFPTSGSPGHDPSIRAKAGQIEWRISERSVPLLRDTVTSKDIARTAALMLSSSIKANSIICRAKEYHPISSAVLNEVQLEPGAELPCAAQAEEQLVIGNLFVDRIKANDNAIRDAANQLSGGLVNDLHNQIKGVDERINSKLTSLVRGSADDVDRLGAELATECTLSVKRLNDRIDLIMRRRRRRFRWIRRGGYLVLEWTLLGLMWWVWLIVVIVRLIRGLIRGIFLTTKWLVWL